MRALTAIAFTLAVVGSACTAHEPSEQLPSPAAEETGDPDETAYDSLAADCEASGPRLAGLLSARVPSAVSDADAISGRVVASCIERGDVHYARCLGTVERLEDVRACAAEWALPWLGIPSCDAYLHDVMCIVDQLSPGQPQVNEALYQAMGAWLDVRDWSSSAEAMDDACTQAMGALIDFPDAPQCFTGRTLRANPGATLSAKKG